MTTRRGARRVDRSRGPRGGLAPRSPGYLPRQPLPGRPPVAGDRRVARPTSPRPDPRALLATLRRRVTAGVVVAFGAFFGLAAVNVVGVTAHGATSPSGATAAAAATPAATAVPSLAPGDFFGRAGAPVSGAGDGGQLALPVAPPLAVGGGAPMVTTGGS